MADAIDELKEGIQRTAVREIGRNSALAGLELGLQADAVRNAFGGTEVAQDPAEFATGYDGTETTVGFTFDISMFDSEDMLT